MLPALADDARITDVMLQIARGEQLDPALVFAPAHHVVTTVLAADGYPGQVRAGDSIALPALGPGEFLFHAGTSERGAELITSGGRVLAATAIGDTLSAAQHRSGALAARVHFAGMFFRRDIGWRALQRGA